MKALVKNSLDLVEPRGIFQCAQMFIHPLNTVPLVNPIPLTSRICQCSQWAHSATGNFTQASMVSPSLSSVFFNFKNVLGHQWLFCWKILKPDLFICLYTLCTMCVSEIERGQSHLRGTCANNCMAWITLQVMSHLWPSLFYTYAKIKNFLLLIYIYLFNNIY